MPFALFNQFSLSYIGLALSSAVTNLSNKTLIFHDLQGPTMTFQAWKMKCLNSMTFQVFHDLYEPCLRSFPASAFVRVPLTLCPINSLCPIKWFPPLGKLQDLFLMFFKVLSPWFSPPTRFKI